MDRSRVAIVIPARDEQRTIAEVVARACAFGRPIVVDDGSTDETADRARRAGAEVVSHPRSRGYDGALNSGFERAEAAGCVYVITCDADGQHDPRLLGDFIALLDRGNDLALGVRDRLPRCGERVFAAVARRAWGISDPMCGMKGYRIALYRRQRRFDSIRGIGSELAIRSAASGARVAELRIPIGERTGTSRFGRRFSANLKILRALLVLLWLRATGRLAL
jgi:glycosyltransferase involved in cell wall biosynthesis